MSEIERAMARDSRAQSLIETARRAIDAVLADEHAARRIGRDLSLVGAGGDALRRASDRITRTWD